MKQRLLTAFVLSITVSLPVNAHHAFAAEFDSAKPVKLTGTITKVEWLNPHARFYLKVQGSEWEIELGSPNGLMRLGWTRYSLKPGDSVIIQGYMARDGSHLAAARGINFSDGRRVVVPPAGDGGPER